MTNNTVKVTIVFVALGGVLIGLYFLNDFSQEEDCRGPSARLFTSCNSAPHARPKPSTAASKFPPL